MSKHILFNNSTTIPAAESADHPHDLDKARIGAFDVDDMGAKNLNLNDATDAKRVIFVQGGDDQPVQTSIINVDDVKRVRKVDYVAPVAQVTEVTPETGEGEATVKVVEASAGFKPHRRMTATVMIDGKTVSEIADAFADQLNKQHPNFITASESNDKLVLTADLGVSFETALDGEAEGWTREVDTTPNFGTGTYEHVKKLEEEAWGQHAAFWNRTYLPVEPERFADSGKTYDLYVIEVRTNTTENIARSNMYQEIYLALEAGAGDIDLEVFFGFEDPPST